VHLQYNPPGGVLGALFARLFGEEPSQQIAEDLRRLKQLLETGEIPATESHPHGSHGAIIKAYHDEVRELNRTLEERVQAQGRPEAGEVWPVSAQERVVRDSERGPFGCADLTSEEIAEAQRVIRRHDRLPVWVR